MKPFMDEDFLLTTETARQLYKNYAKKMPIYDYHCHLNSKEIYDDNKYNNLTEVWLNGDHYKWRAMRSNGVDEEYITGNASDYEKFLKWAKTVPYLIGNPLYHWTHLELQRYFDIYEPLNERTAQGIWEKANAKLSQDDFSVRGLIKRSYVKVICTTDDPTDDLIYHKNLKGKMEAKVLPTFRPDKFVDINKATFVPFIEKLEVICGEYLDKYDKLLNALKGRIEYFNEVGCRISDHSLDFVPYAEVTYEEVAKIYQNKLSGKQIDGNDELKYKTFTLQFVAKEYSRLGWTMQIHIGALRNNNTQMFEKMGADIGFDSINDLQIAQPLSRFLDSLERNDALPKTILYTLNPKDNYVLGTMMGNFQSSNVAGKIQFGSGWWFNDNIDGMVAQMRAVANLGLLSKFNGMTTDSRSFLSYTRHEYFRRILCNLIGEWVENGEYPNDVEILGIIVQDICYNNAVNYFGIEV